MMNRKLILILILCICSLDTWSQINISGIVISKEDKLPLSGVIVEIKGTKTATTTDINGAFNIEVDNKEAILIFSFVGFIPLEYKLKGKDSITVIMKSDCHIDTFDHQLISIYLSSGVINNPIGGQLNFSFPAFFRATTLKSGISYQSDFNKNGLLNAQIEFDHLILKCDFRMDVKWFYRKVSYEQNFESRANSIETTLIFYDLHDLNITNIGLIAGISELSLEKIGTRVVSYGPLIGLRAYLGKPLWMLVSGKISMFRNNLEYQGEISFSYKRLSAFTKLYKLDKFTELSLGVGINMGYRLKKQRKKNAA